jgi:hypothetical protein
MLDIDRTGGVPYAPDPISENGKNPEIRLPRPIGTECSAVVLGVKVRQEPSSVSLHPPKPRPPTRGLSLRAARHTTRRPLVQILFRQ